MEPYRLANPDREAVEVVEAPLGDHLGEDDIVRLEEDCRRRGEGEPGGFW